MSCSDVLGSATAFAQGNENEAQPNQDNNTVSLMLSCFLDIVAAIHAEVILDIFTRWDEDANHVHLKYWRMLGVTERMPSAVLNA